MNKTKFSYTGFWIVFTLVFTIGIQVYRNIQNYRINQRQLLLEVQLCLDNSVEAYYADLAKNDILTFSGTFPDSSLHLYKARGENGPARVVINPMTETMPVPEMDSLLRLVPSALKGDSSVFFKTIRRDSVGRMAVGHNVFKFRKAILDSNGTDGLKELTRRIVISLSLDTLDFERLDACLQDELARQNIQISYALRHYNHGELWGKYNGDDLHRYPLRTVSKSTFLPRMQRLEMHFENPALAVLQRGVADLLISLLFLAAVAFSLNYLHRNIRSQKELAAIKNDLINNITHEFKTPIATVTSALEGIEHFNEANDPKKTKKYLTISHQQLKKLNTMVEKLLETATLDSEHLMLQKEKVDIKRMLMQLTGKFRGLTSKSISLDMQGGRYWSYVDPFHLENALANLLDNAIKYGGEEIRISLHAGERVMISVADNGGHISPDQKDKVFDQFYRIPKGNRHDVKGFGIGLYYAKRIIEKHRGSIRLDISSGWTTFVMDLP